MDPGASPLADLRSTTVDPIADARWQDLVTASPDAQIFHSSAWLRMVTDEYRYPMEAWCLERDDGQLVAGLPVATVRSRLTGSRLVAVPFSDVCTPIHRSPDDSLARAMTGCVEQQRSRRGLALEVHGPMPMAFGSEVRERFYHHQIPLSEAWPDSLARMHDSKRRAARRATRLGVTVARRTDPGAIGEFFGMHVQTRHRHGVPTQPKRFFARLAAIFEQGMGFVLLADHEGRTVAASVYLRFGDVLTYKYGASDPRELKLRANVLLFHEAIRLACEDGCRALDLGRTEFDNPGLQTFKRQLGGEERVLEYAWLGGAPKGTGARSVSELQKTIIRRTPPVVGRLLGAALYRHFA